MEWQNVTYPCYPRRVMKKEHKGEYLGALHAALYQSLDTLSTKVAYGRTLK